MPLQMLDTGLPNVQLGLWTIREVMEEAYLDQLVLSPTEQGQLDSITHPDKRMEWLSSRLCLKQMLQRPDVEVLNTDEGKPYLSDHSHQISFTHSYPHCAVIASDTHHVGVDIECFKYRSEYLLLAQKFMNPEELNFFFTTANLLFFYITWSAKETLFKLNAQRGISFRENISIDCRNWKQKQNGTDRKSVV